MCTGLCCTYNGDAKQITVTLLMVTNLDSFWTIIELSGTNCIKLWPHRKSFFLYVCFFGYMIFFMLTVIEIVI